MDFLYEVLAWGYLVLYAYYFLIVIDIVASWTPLRRTGFYQFLEKVTGPYTRIFSNKLIVGGVFDLGHFLGVVLYQVILAFIGSVL